MRYSDLIQLYFERSNALQWYWTLYVVVAGGLLAFSSLRVRRDAITGLLVTVLFCMFAYKNLGAIHDTTVQRLATLQAIGEFPPEASATGVITVSDRLGPTLVAPEYDGVRDFHVASDILIVAAFWAMELRRVKASRHEPGETAKT